MRETMLILHFLGLTMGLGTGFAHAFLGKAAARMPAGDAKEFRLHTLVLSNMGHIGIFLLIISGVYLMTPYWKTVPSSPLLILKLSLVAILMVLITLIYFSVKKARNGDAENQLKRLQGLGKLTLLVGVAIVIVAVSIFH